MTLSSAAAQAVLEQCILGTTTFTVGTPHAAIAANGGAEVTGTGYARQPLTFGVAAGDPAAVATSAETDFGTVAGDWSPLTLDEVRVYNALTAGTELAADTDTAITYAAGNRAFVTAPITITLGDNSIFSAAYSATVLEWLFRGAAVPARAQYLGLLNSGTELSGGNYARLDTDTLWATPTLADPSSISFTGGAQTFIASATFTGATNQMGLYAAATGGTPLITIGGFTETVATNNEVTVNPTITLT